MAAEINGGRAILQTFNFKIFVTFFLTLISFSNDMLSLFRKTKQKAQTRNKQQMPNNELKQQQVEARDAQKVFEYTTQDKNEKTLQKKSDKNFEFHHFIIYIVCTVPCGIMLSAAKGINNLQLTRHQHFKISVENLQLKGGNR